MVVLNNEIALRIRGILRLFLNIVGERWARADQITVTKYIVNSTDRGPVGFGLALIMPRGRESSLLARVFAVPGFSRDNVHGMRGMLQR